MEMVFPYDMNLFETSLTRNIFQLPAWKNKCKLRDFILEYSQFSDIPWYVIEYMGYNDKSCNHYLTK